MRMVPYAVLGVPFDADDDSIRKAYLKQLKVTTPDREPERFKTLAWAYRSIATAEDRRRLFLNRDNGELLGFEVDQTFDNIKRNWLQSCKTPPSFDAMMKQWRRVSVHG